VDGWNTLAAAISRWDPTPRKDDSPGRFRQLTSYCVTIGIPGLASDTPGTGLPNFHCVTIGIRGQAFRRATEKAQPLRGIGGLSEISVSPSLSLRFHIARTLM
jgi:hypothetical protein